MLDLKSPKWGELSHAYGAATDTPELLKRIYAGPTDEDWSDLYGTVAHQGSISTAAYAAVPHVVAAGRLVAKTDQLPYLSFVAFVLKSYEHEPIPASLRADYESAVVEAGDLALGLLSGQLDYGDSVYLMQALSAFSSRIPLARVIEGIADGEFQVDCSACSGRLYVEKEGEGLKTYASDPIREPEGKSTDVKPRAWSVSTRGEFPHELADLQWLAEVAKPLGPAASEDFLKVLDGECTCPTCGNTFFLYNELARQAD